MLRRLIPWVAVPRAVPQQRSGEEMKIKQLRVDIEPFGSGEDGTKVRVEVFTRDKIDTYVQVYPTDHFESLFSRFMEAAEQLIKKQIQDRE